MDKREEKTAWGPKMAALPNERWRNFVTFWLDGAPGGRGKGKGYTEAARRAGFGDGPGLPVTAHKLAHDQRIQEAIQEEARRRLVCAVPTALQALSEIADDKHHKDRLGAAKTILDRTGLHEVHEDKHTLQFIGDDPAMLERVRQIAQRLNVPVADLLGRTAAKLLPAPLPTQEAEFEEVK